MTLHARRCPSGAADELDGEVRFPGCVDESVQQIFRFPEGSAWGGSEWAVRQRA